ncbi:SDR family oxidoreductase [Streptoalloteichus hindustanus]|uniref:SDR family oxidoreductase n=1 Tax=Streptoalloteichus hindustanus TaxID=2017 RepID=UPI00190E7859|nr:SDR family oxidoreductase [Streptoalloteichus hindustanus]
MKDQLVVVIGGSSGIGFEVARRVVADGGEVVLGGRDRERLDQAVAALGPAASSRVVDVTDKSSIAAFFDPLTRVDHLFTPGSSYGRGRLTEISDELAESPFRSKFWGQYYAVKNAVPKLADTGSVVLMAGAYSVRPPVDGAAYAACNGALESLGRALALELSPIRVNVVSPGMIDSDLWARLPQDVRERNAAAFSRDTLVGRPGTVAEAAQAVLYLMTNTYTTGSVLYPDGGFSLR